MGYSPKSHNMTEHTCIQGGTPEGWERCAYKVVPQRDGRGAHEGGEEAAAL